MPEIRENSRAPGDRDSGNGFQVGPSAVLFTLAHDRCVQVPCVNLLGKMRSGIWVPFLLGSLAVAAPAPKPNIVLLLADDLGWTDIAVKGTTLGNGSKYHQTPQLDSLANQGMTFSSMYVQQNCTPTRAALMSGQYAPRTRMFNVDSLDRGAQDSVILPPQQTTILKPEAITMAETLQSAGYFTAHFGKWHMGPANLITKVHGFNISYSRGDAANDDVDEIGRILAGGAVPNFFAHPGKSGGWVFGGYGGGMKPFADPYTAEYVAKNLQPYADGNNPRTLIGKPKHLTDAMADAVDDFLGTEWPKAGKDKPFFMYVAFNQVHSPINPRPDMLAKYQKIDSTDPRHVRADYAAFVDHLDQVIGRILARLEDPNGDGDKSDSVAANTVVLFMSDNGGPFGATDNLPLRGCKGMHYDGGLRVPLIVRWPGVTKPGSSTVMLHAVDMYPTLSSIAGAKLPDPKAHPLDGESFTGILRGSRTELQRKSIYWHFPGYMDTRAVPVTSVIKNVGADRYKLLYFYEPRRYEMYKLSADIGEKNDLMEGAPDRSVMAIATDLRNDMLAWLARMNPPAMKYRADGKEVPGPVPFAESTRKPTHVQDRPARRAAKQ